MKKVQYVEVVQSNKMSMIEVHNEQMKEYWIGPQEKEDQETNGWMELLKFWKKDRGEESAYDCLYEYNGSQNRQKP